MSLFKNGVNRGYRKTHKWLSLFVGLQMLIWLFSGAYMVLMEIQFIRGQHLTNTESLLLEAPSQVKFSIEQLLQIHPNATKITLFQGVEGPRYRYSDNDNLYVISATTGQPIANIDSHTATEIAALIYTGTAAVKSAVRYDSQLPTEISPGLAPVWQVNFEDPASTSLYISATTGELVSKRHDYWRVFDFMWMLHIMDYDEREDIHNLLLTLMSLLALITAISGLILAYYSFRPKQAITDTQQGAL